MMKFFDWIDTMPSGQWAGLCAIFIVIIALIGMIGCSWDKQVKKFNITSGPCDNPNCACRRTPPQV